jgi:endo-1,4-beta-xylanase
MIDGDGGGGGGGGDEDYEYHDRRDGGEPHPAEAPDYDDDDDEDSPIALATTGGGGDHRDHHDDIRILPSTSSVEAGYFEVPRQQEPAGESIVAADGGGAAANEDDDDEEDDDEEEDEADLTLKHYASLACKRIDVGTAVMPSPLFEADVEDYASAEIELHDALRSLPTTEYARFVLREFNSVVVEHHLKWGPLCGEGTPGGIRLGSYDFATADRMVDWALARGLKVKGHVLVWSVTSPPILKELDPERVREETRRHIFTVVGHFRGRIKVWDVVNEPLSPDGEMARNVFWDKLGPDYVATCLAWAHEADPAAALILNENKVEGVGSAKSERFYELCRDLVQRRVPLHGVGLQAHFNAAGVGRNRPPSPHQVKRQIRRLGNLGLSVNLSELDVRVSQLAPEHRAPAQAAIYHDVVAAALSEPACDGIWVWGFSDRHTWVTHFYYDDEPTISDEDYRKKPAYYALREAIKSLAVGGVVGGGNRLDPVLLASSTDANGNEWGHTWIQPEPDRLLDEVSITERHGRQDSSVFRGTRQRGFGSGGGDPRPDWLVEAQEGGGGDKELDSGEDGPPAARKQDTIHEGDEVAAFDATFDGSVDGGGSGEEQAQTMADGAEGNAADVDFLS